jgi:hypothetical protein
LYLYRRPHAHRMLFGVVHVTLALDGEAATGTDERRREPA